MGEGRDAGQGHEHVVPSPAAFGRAFRAFLEESVKGRADEDPPFVARLAEHFGQDPRGLPIVSERLPKIEHPNVQAAFEAWISGEGRSSELVGVAAEHKRFTGLSLADLVAPAGGGLGGMTAPRPGPVDYANVAVGRDRVRAYVQHGLYLLRDCGEPIAALVSVPGEFGEAPPINVEVTAPRPETASRFFEGSGKTCAATTSTAGRCSPLATRTARSAPAGPGSSSWRSPR